MRGFLGARALVGLTLLAFLAIAVMGGSASAASGACATKAGLPPRANHISGVVSSVPVDLGCVSSDNAANGDPPLI
jgi:hypothetical protein